MARSIIQSESLNLADDFAFTGTVTGAGDVLDATTTVPSEGGAVTTNLVQGLAKAWCATDGDTTVNDSLNISSVSDFGSGDNSFVVINNMGSSTWCASGFARSDDNAGRRAAFMQFAADASYMGSNYTRIHCNYDNSNAREPEYTTVIFHGDLA